MKKILCLLALLFPQTYSFAIEPIDIKGYYVIASLKNEVVADLDQKVWDLTHRTHSVNIDDRSFEYFVPLCVGEQFILDGSDSILKEIKRYTIAGFSDETFYFLPTTFYRKDDFERDLKKYFDEQINVSREICILRKNKQLPFYYINKKDDKYIYKIIYLEGQAFETTILNNSEMRPMKIAPDLIEEGVKEIKLYYIIDIINYTPIVDIAGLELWYPYISH